MRRWLPLLALTLSAAYGAQGPRLEVLRADAYGDILDVLVRVDLPPEKARGLKPQNFSVFIAPADLPRAKATSPQYRPRRMFLWRRGDSFFIDLRQLPPGTTARTCQLIVRVQRQAAEVFSARLPAILEPAAEQLDVALIIDESLSMRRTDREELRLAAAKTFVDLARTSTRIANIAIVAFNDRTRTLLPPTPVTQTSTLYKAIERIRAGGQTDMDAALEEARALLERSPAPAKAALLLTDGKDEPGRYRDAHQEFARRRWPVYTVGLSQRADAETLERIARQTGGEFHLAPTNAELQEIFSRICLTLLKKVPIRRHRLAIQPNAPANAPFLIDETITSLTISTTSRIPELAFALQQPDGIRLTPQTTRSGVAFDRKGGYQHYDLWTPGPGRWLATLAAGTAGEATVTATAATPLLLRAFPVKKTYYRGEPATLAASLACGDSVLPIARVEAKVVSPEGKTTVELFDDGRHQDTAPGDGVFAGLFPGCDSPGPVKIRLLATGRSPGGHPFERELTLQTTISPQGYSRLWCSAKSLDFGPLYTGEKAQRTLDLKLTTEVPSRNQERVRVSIEPPVAEDGSRLPTDALSLEPSPLVLAPGQLRSLAANLAIPPDQPPGRYQTAIRLTSNYDALEVPVVFEVRRPEVILGAKKIELPPVESGGRARAELAVRLAPRGALPLSVVASDQRLSVEPTSLTLGPKARRLTIQFSAPPDSPTEQPRMRLTLRSPGATVEVPVVARVVRPTLALEPQAIDFGAIRPGQTAKRAVTLRLEALSPRRVQAAAQPLRSEGNAPPLGLAVPAQATIRPGEPLALEVSIEAPPIQSPGKYVGSVTIHSPLGEHEVPCTATVPAVSTFATAPALEFGRVAIGSTAEKPLELTSTANAPQTVRLVPPAPTGGCAIEAAPASVAVPPMGKATARIRLEASRAAEPGPFSASLAVVGPSQGAKVELRAELFRPPHQSIAFEPPVADLGRLTTGTPASVTVAVRSLVDEPQDVSIVEVHAPEDLVAVEPQQWALRVAGHATEPFALTVTPLAAEGEKPFEAVVVARGRSLPTRLRVRGTIVAPAATTIRLLEGLLDFGTVERGGRATLALTLESLLAAEQRVELTRPPTSPGLSLAADPPMLTLAPGAVETAQVELVVGEDAPLGTHRLLWPIAGAGKQATLEVAVEVVPKPVPIAAGREPTGIGWQEGLIIFLLLAILVVALILAYLLARWLLRTKRLPRMTKYFALSALLHAVVLFTALDLFIAHKTRKKELGELFRVGLKAMAPGGFSTRRRSLADEIRARQERERRLAAERRKRQAAELARKLLEEAKLKTTTPHKAKLRRPETEEKPRLVAHKPRTQKLTVEELARILEEVRESKKITEKTKEPTEAPKPVEAERLERLRRLSREQLEAVVEQALAPKKTAPSKPRSKSGEAPGLVAPRLLDRGQFRPDELVPALEGLKAAAQARAAAKTAGGAVGSQQVAVTRAARGAEVERGTPRGVGAPAPSRPAAAPVEGKAPGQAAAPDLLVASLEGTATRARRQVAVEPETPGDLAPRLEAHAPVATARGGRAGTVAARSLAVGRVEGSAGPQRAAAAARPLAPGQAREGRLARAVERGGPAAPALEAARAPASAVPQAPPFAATIPEELPPADAAVELPTGAPRPTEHVEAVALAIAPGHGRGKPASDRAAAQAPRPTAPGPRGVAAAGAALRRVPAPPAPVAAEMGEGAAARKARPRLEEVVLVEGPLSVAHYEQPGRKTEIGSATVVGQWRLRARGAARASEGGTAALGEPAPRAGGVARPSSGSAAADLELPPAERVAAHGPDDLVVRLEEAVREAPRVAAGAREAAEGPGAVAAPEWSGGAARVERSEVGAGATLAPEGPASAEVGPPRAALTPELLAEAVAGRGRRALVASPQVEIEEEVDTGPGAVAARRRAEPEARGGLEAERRGEEPRPHRLEARAVRPTLAARSPRLERSPSYRARRLLPPSLARGFGEAGTIVGEKPTGTTRFVLTVARYGGGEADWDTHKTMMPFLAWQLRERVGFNVETDVREVGLESPEVMKSPWIFITGHNDFRFTAAQVANLRRYLLAGGTLWAEDCTHEDNPTWDRAFRREIARVLPPEEGYRLKKITKADDHPIFRSCFDLSEGYKGYFPPPGDKYRENYIEGIEIDGRLAVIYTRNDYGCGLEIRPDTTPLKVSLSGLSLAEMQESSFLMATNIIVYILGGGRGRDVALIRRAAESLRHHYEAEKARPDPYANAPATLFDDFSEENWLVEDTWDGAGPARLRYLRKPNARGRERRLAVSLDLDRGDVKTVLIREIPEELDLTGQDRCYVEVESKLDTGARLALAVVTLPDWKYFESRPAFIKPGKQAVWFDLRGSTWKTGEPVPEGQNEYCRRPENLDAVRRFVLLIYPLERRGTMIFDKIEFRAKP